MFKVEENFPDHRTISRVHERSDFRRFWLPVILTLVHRVNVQYFEHG